MPVLPRADNAYIGTSGWNYADWIGPLYPRRLASYRDLAFYAEHYRTVENNSSFYRIASADAFRSWQRAVPDGFIFSLKLNRLFTHEQKLALTAESETILADFLNRLQVLGDKLGCLLIQTPPSLRCDTALLDDFLGRLRSYIRPLPYKPDLAIEFRHASWFGEGAYAQLRQHDTAWVSAQSSRYPGERIVTAGHAYIRLHGPGALFASPYSAGQLADWNRYISSLGNLRRVYVYFNNTSRAYAVENARLLLQMRSGNAKAR